MARNPTFRPKAIWWFDGMMLVSMALSAIDVILNWSLFEAEIAADPVLSDSGLVEVVAFGSIAFGFGLYFLLWFFISLRASKVAKWILVVVALLSVGTIALTLTTGIDLGEIWLGLLSNLMLAAATVMLFVPGASDWFNPQVLPSTFD